MIRAGYSHFFLQNQMPLHAIRIKPRPARAFA